MVQKRKPKLKKVHAAKKKARTAKLLVEFPNTTVRNKSNCD